MCDLWPQVDWLCAELIFDRNKLIYCDTLESWHDLDKYLRNHIKHFCGDHARKSVFIIKLYEETTSAYKFQWSNELGLYALYIHFHFILSWISLAIDIQSFPDWYLIKINGEDLCKSSIRINWNNFESRILKGSEIWWRAWKMHEGIMVGF